MFLKELFCNHEYEFDGNIYGDRIILANYCRTIYKCKKCGKYKYYPAYIKQNFYWENYEHI